MVPSAAESAASPQVGELALESDMLAPMKRGVTRREFLKTVVISAGAVQAAPLLGCGGNGGTGTPDAGPDAPIDAPPAMTSFPQSVASGDPRPDSIVLWTRAASTGTADVDVVLEVATDDQFAHLVSLSTGQLTAKLATDFCLRVKVTGLTAATRYYYRFRAGTVVSPTGRFKTAAAAGADVPIKFALLSCQDYVGRYYNTLLELLAAAQDDIDFVVHVGDYVYETTGDPGFQQNQGRNVTFADQAGAIRLGSATNPYYAAKSLSNYRDLYKTYRSDPTLQKVHEKFPFVVIWDDHEYSNDCWQDVATYFDGKQDEKDTERRQNAEQAYFEFQPIAVDVETGGGALSLSRSQLFPNLKLYRDFRFGKHVHLILTDFRSFRPDHPIAEDAYPGKVVMDQAQTMATLTAVGSSADINAFPAYVNLDDAGFAAQKAKAIEVLTAQYVAAGLASAAAAARASQAAQGNVDVSVLNTYWDALDPLHIDPSGKSHGVSYASMGKQTLFGQIGSRYLIVKPTYDLWAAFRVAQNGEADDPYGAAQSAWLDDQLAAESDATWKMLASSTSQTTLGVDLTPFSALLPPDVPATQLYLDCDGWDGFPVGQKALHAKLAAKNVVIVSGDIHASYVADFGADVDGNRLVELTGTSVSAQTFAGELHSEAALVPGLADHLDLVDTLISLLDDSGGPGTGLLYDINHNIRYANSYDNGVVVVSVDASSLAATYALLAPAEALTDSTASPDVVAGKVKRVRVQVSKTGGQNGAVTVTRP